MGVSDIRDLVYDEFGERTGILRGPRRIDSNIIAKTIVIVLLQKLKQRTQHHHRRLTKNKCA